MKVLVSNEQGGFAAQESAEPPPAAGELLVRVCTATVGPRDLRMARLRAGFRPGSDFAGVVEKAAGRSCPQVGDRVVGVIPGGAWAEMVAVPVRSVCKLPDGIGFAAGATAAGTGLTALYALERCGSLLGKRVLVTAATGSVGYLACQLAALAGARVTGWARADPVAGWAAERAELVTGEIGAVAAPRGPFDVAIEMVGGGVLESVLTLMAPAGRLVIVGAASGEKSLIDAATIYQGTLEITGFGLFPELAAKPASDGLKRLFALLQGGGIRVPEADVRPALLPGVLDQPATGRRVVLEFDAQ